MTEITEKWEPSPDWEPEPIKRSHRLLLIFIAIGFAIVCTLIGAMVWELDEIRRAL